jgi:hypothetical protein
MFIARRTLNVARLRICRSLPIRPLNARPFGNGLDSGQHSSKFPNERGEKSLGDGRQYHGVDVSKQEKVGRAPIIIFQPDIPNAGRRTGDASL